MQQVVAGVGMFLGTAACAVAQEAAAAAASPAVNEYGMSLKQAWGYGGWIMWVLAAISVFALAMVFYFMAVLRTNVVTPRELMVDLLARIRSNDINEVRRLCERHPCPLASVVLSMLDCLRNVPQCDVSLLRGAAESEGARQADAIQGQTEFLLDVATIAPLLGLLGTVGGMIQAFFETVHLQPGANRADYLAEGIYKALVTTFAGLSIAIPAALLAHMFEGRIQRLFRELDEFILTLLPQLERFEGRLRGNHETIDVAEYPRNPIAREAVEPARRSPDPVKKP